MILLLAAGCTDPPGTEPSPGAVPPPTTTTAPGPGPSAPGVPAPAPSRSLIDAVRRDGTLRVIVTLAAPYTPEANLSGPDAVRRQRAAIAAAQDRLLDELRPLQARVHARYEHTPQLALTVNEAALLRLLASPLVGSVQQDAADGTATG
ncbi:hypothetical protein [Micromonospora sp. NPDC050200]|uniref:hypothetical protein n=1 Tax=Micromonospora sp. NPDC050200 TaxID=3155664 RepID=UPI0033D94286